MLPEAYDNTGKADIATTTDHRVVPLLADVTKAEEVQDTVDTLLQEFGCITAQPRRCRAA